MDRLPLYIGIPAAIVANVALSWDSLTGLSLYPRLLATLVLAGVLQELVARAWALGSAQNEAVRHPSRAEGRPMPCGGWCVCAAIALAITAAMTVGLSWLQTDRLVVSAVRGTQDGKQSLTLAASWVNADEVSLPLPGSRVTCEINEIGASLTEVDWAKPTRLLKIHDFVAPQTVVVVCDTEEALGQRQLKITGKADGPYFAAELRCLRFLICVLGGLLWFYGIFRLHRLSR